MKEINDIKKFYGISRRTLHLICGISEDALMRYERGKEIPHKYKLLLSAMCNLDAFERLFHLSKAVLKANEIEKIEKKLIMEITWREREARECRYKLMNIQSN